MYSRVLHPLLLLIGEEEAISTRKPTEVTAEETTAIEIAPVVKCPAAGMLLSPRVRVSAS